MWGLEVLVVCDVKGGMHSGPEIHGFRRGGFQYGVFRISDTAAEFRHGAHVTAGVPLFGSRTGPMGTKLAHLQFNLSRSISSRRRALDL